MARRQCGPSSCSWAIPVAGFLVFTSRLQVVRVWRGHLEQVCKKGPAPGSLVFPPVRPSAHMAHTCPPTCRSRTDGESTSLVHEVTMILSPKLIISNKTIFLLLILT